MCAKYRRGNINMWIGIPICIIAIICSAVGVGLPYWAEYEHKTLGLKFHYGIYQVCSDWDLLGCEFTDPSGTMIAVRALETLGTLLLLIAVVLALVKQCSTKDRQAHFKIAGGLAFIAALVTFVGIAIFGAMRVKQFTSGGDNTAVNYTFQAGFYISIVAGVLGLIAGLLFRIDKTIENCRRQT